MLALAVALIVCGVEAMASGPAEGWGFCQSTGDGNDFPKEADRLGIQRGEAVVEFTLTAEYKVTNVRVLSASHPVFASAAERAVKGARCEGPPGRGRDTVVRIPFKYVLE